jgi:hypothetical protein
MAVMVWRSRMLDNLRPPTRKELMAAWNSMMQYKKSKKVPLNSTQALQCRRLLEYLTKPAEDGQNVKQFSSAHLALTRQVLLEIEPHERSREHLDLAKSLYQVLSSGQYKGQALSADTLWSQLVLSMCRFNGALEASKELYAKWDDPEYQKYTNGSESLLESVAQALANEGHETELLRLLEFAENHGVPYSSALQETVTAFFAQRDRTHETKHWFTKPLAKGHSRPTLYPTVASFAARNQLQDWAMPFFLELGQAQPPKACWDALLRSALLVGMTLPEAQVMMSHMVDKRKEQLTPDTATINSLLRVAAERADSGLASEILALSAEMSIRPNEETYLILFAVHIACGDVLQAQAALGQLQYADSVDLEIASKMWDEYGQLINKYLLLLCCQTPPDFKLIIDVLATVEEEETHLEPETVASLCLRFLENDQHFDVMDILSIHSFRYSEAQRAVVQGAFLSFCLDSATSTSRSWQAYQILQQFFQDLSLDKRVELLQAFFDRKRPDMATHVFGHMRQHRNKMYHPTADTYVLCFEGFSRCPDREGTDTVHNMLKMDMRMQPDTRVYTALILAYAACDAPLKALDYWNEVRQSREGPSYATLEAVLWALEKKSGGAKDARELWERITALDLEIPARVFNAYVGAIASDGNEKEVRGLIMKMASFVGTEPDAMT